MRIAFAEEHGDQNPEYYFSFVFADEKTFSSNTDGKVVLYRPRNTQYVENWSFPLERRLRTIQLQMGIVGPFYIF